MGTKSFSLAAARLPRAIAADAAVLHAYWRRADDTVRTPADPSIIDPLRGEIDSVYGSEPLVDPMLASTRELVLRRSVPRVYFDELLAGLSMEASGATYESLADLVTHAYRVSGTLGLMMCHVMGVRDRATLLHAAHLGIAMQLTNVARTVSEDWHHGRLYLPEELLKEAGVSNLHVRLGGPFPLEAVGAVSAATEELLLRADAYYRSGDSAIARLPTRCAFAVRAARHVHSRIGAYIRAQGCSPVAPRAAVPRRHKMMLVARALLETVVHAPAAVLAGGEDDPVDAFDFGELPLLEMR